MEITPASVCFFLCELQITKSAPDAKSLSEITQSETHQDVPFGRAGHSFGRADHAIGHKHKRHTASVWFCSVNCK